MNTFGYVGQSPLMFTDPNGLNPVAGALGGPPSAIVGGIIGAVLGGAAAYSLSQDDASATDKSTSDSCEDEKCPPCKTISGRIVPIETVAYRPLDVIPDDRMEHGVYGSHHNIFVAKQAPRNSPQPCRCQWVKQKYVLKPDQLTSDMIPIEPFIY